MKHENRKRELFDKAYDLNQATGCKYIYPRYWADGFDGSIGVHDPATGEIRTYRISPINDVDESELAEAALDRIAIIANDPKLLREYDAVVDAWKRRRSAVGVFQSFWDFIARHWVSFWI